MHDSRTVARKLNIAFIDHPRELKCLATKATRYTSTIHILSQQDAFHPQPLPDKKLPL
jgi:hypothetical protein